MTDLPAVRTGRFSVEPHGLPFGEDAAGRMVAVADVERGLACGLVCPHCRSRLIAKKGDVIAHHLAHEADMACAGAYETALHKMAKQIITDAGALCLPLLVARLGSAHRTVQPSGPVSFDRVEMEVWMDGMRPDIVGYRKDTPLAVEILVSHRCGPEKVALFRSKKLGAVEIDLSGLDRDITVDTLQPLVLSTAPRSWVFHPGHDAALAQLHAEAKARAAEARAREDEAAAQAARAAAKAAKIIEEARVARELFLQRSRHPAEPLLASLREKEGQRRAEEAKRWQEKREQERLKALEEKKQRDAARVTIIKKALYKHAEAMVGDVFAANFMANNITTKYGASLRAPCRMEDPEDERLYWGALHDAIRELDLAEKAKHEARTSLVKQAVQAFRSEERAELWARSRHPALGMVAPAQACTDQSGMTKCLGLLRKVPA